MNRSNLATQLKIDEGSVLQAYLDSRRNLTVGVGHLARPEDRLILGQTITEAQCDQFLEHDISIAVITCVKIWPHFEDLPEEVQEILANMAFQLGETRLRLFVQVIDAVNHQQWRRAAGQMRASLWYEQSGDRSERLVARMQAVEAA